MHRFSIALLSVLAVVAFLFSASAQERSTSPKRLIAHRGASAYAPEHTAAAYRLAMEQGADYVEQDLAVTKDNVLICLHDESLERTTNVEEVFPDRSIVDASGHRTWLAAEFTLAEIKRLDAGSWFDPKFASERILTFDEAVALVGDRAGLYPELKTPALYRARGVDQTALFVAAVRRLKLDARPRGTLVVQSFDPQPLRDITMTMPALPRTFLIDGRDAGKWFTADGMKQVAAFATDVSPAKQILDGHPELVTLAHRAGLTVTPYTVSTRNPSRFTDVTAEMRYYLYDLSVDALFTDNPDRFPRSSKQ